MDKENLGNFIFGFGFFFPTNSAEISRVDTLLLLLVADRPHGSF